MNVITKTYEYLCVERTNLRIVYFIIYIFKWDNLCGGEKELQRNKIVSARPDWRVLHIFRLSVHFSHSQLQAYLISVQFSSFTHTKKIIESWIHFSSNKSIFFFWFIFDHFKRLRFTWQAAKTNSNVTIGWRFTFTELPVVEEAAAESGQIESVQQDIGSPVRICNGN